MKSLAILIASANFASAQIFYSAEEFYRYLEHKARMAQIEKGAEVSSPTDGPEWDRFNKETADWLAGRRKEHPVPPAGWELVNPKFWE